MDKLQKLISAHECCITYSPFAEEVPVPVPENILSYTVPSRTDTDPTAEAEKIAAKTGSRSVCVLVPGTRFDAEGTRHGRGGGWYDRFLSRVPKAWVRIGICSATQFSNEPLTREAWDEPMDYVYVAGPPEPLLVLTRARE